MWHVSSRSGEAGLTANYTFFTVRVICTAGGRSSVVTCADLVVKRYAQRATLRDDDWFAILQIRHVEQVFL